MVYSLSPTVGDFTHGGTSISSLILRTAEDLGHGGGGGGRGGGIQDTVGGDLGSESHLKDCWGPRKGEKVGNLTPRFI